MLGFLIGLMIGGFMGVFIMSMVVAASRADKWMEHHNSNLE